MLKKIFISIFIFILIFNITSNVFAIEISKADLVQIDTADNHLKYYREDRGYSTFLKCSVVGYYKGEKFYPAYCMNRDLPGAESGEYTVNVKELINNPAVWRVVTNGYPYLEPHQMGLDKVSDAYAVTKFAVYCVLGQANIDYFSADSTDSVGCHMLDVLKNLVNIGINGTDVPKTGNIYINENSHLGDAGEYIFKDYVVNSNLNIRKYFVENITGFPEGTYIADNTNMQKWDFESGQIFRVLIPKSGLNYNINGKINVRAESQNYPVFYGESPVPELQDYVITYDTYGDEYANTNFNINTNNGSLKVIKIDEETKKPLSEVKFELKNEQGKIYEAITNSNGEAYFNDLFQGKYILREVQTSEQYLLKEVPFDINIEYGKMSEITIDNSIRKGKIKVIKVDKDNKEPIPNVKFNIIDKNTGKIIETLITNENGESISTDLRVDGKYVLKEIEVNEKYFLEDKEYEFTVESDEIFEFNIENEKLKNKFKIVKIDSQDKSIKLEGVKFEVYDKDMKLLEVLETDENGEVQSREYPIIGEKYYIKEVKSKDGYMLNDGLIEINLLKDEILEVIIKNEKIPEKPIIPEESPPETIEPPIEIEEPKEVLPIVIRKLPKTGK